MQLRTTLIRPLVSRSLVAAAGAVAATCAVLPAAYAMPGSAATHAAPVIRPCGASHNLRVRTVLEHRTAGTTSYTLELTNTGSYTCSLSGYPAVSAITRAGRQLGSPAGHGLLSVAPRVTLVHGATAHTTLVYHGGLVGAGRGCGPVRNAFELRVYIAGQRLAMYAAFGSRACSHSGHVYLTITEPLRRG